MQPFTPGEDEADTEYGGPLQHPHDNVPPLKSGFTSKGEIAAGNMRAGGEMTGPAHLAVLWFGLVGAIGGGVIWAAAGWAAGAAVMVMMLIVIAIYQHDKAD